MRRLVCLLLALVVLPLSGPVSEAAPPGRAEPLAMTPPMGFNNWNAFGCDVTEALVKETADALVSSGLAGRGYEYVNIDDCWSLRERGADGRLVPDPAKFPSGIEGVADYPVTLTATLVPYQFPPSGVVTSRPCSPSVWKAVDWVTVPPSAGLAMVKSCVPEGLPSHWT